MLRLITTGLGHVRRLLHVLRRLAGLFGRLLQRLPHTFGVELLTQPLERLGQAFLRFLDVDVAAAQFAADVVDGGGDLAGAFHVALATAYLIEYFKYRGIAVMLAAKSIAFVFLLVTPIFVSVPWAVPFSGVADGAMALTVWWVHRKVGAAPAS